MGGARVSSLQVNQSKKEKKEVKLMQKFGRHTRVVSTHDKTIELKVETHKTSMTLPRLSFVSSGKS